MNWLRGRRRLLAYSAPVAVMLIVAIVKLVSVGLAGDSAATHFAARDAAALRDDVAVLNRWNVIEPSKAHFAAGALAVLDGRLEDADAQFSAALAGTAPAQSCPARINLALVREAQGDKAFAALDGQVTLEVAVERYRSALTVLDAAPPGCAPESVRSRLADELAAAQAPPPAPPSA